MNLGAGIVLLLMAARASAAAADEVDTQAVKMLRAREHYDVGRAQFRLGRYREAATEFEASYGYQKLPLLLYNIGQSRRMAGDRSAALKAYRQFLTVAPEAAEGTEVRQYVDELEEALRHEPPPRDPVQLAPTARSAPGPGLPSLSVPRHPTRRRQLWIGLGVAAAVLIGAGVATALVLTLPRGAPDSDLGNYVPFGR
jgi:tetratricopeptide (TPR) repeat protein